MDDFPHSDRFGFKTLWTNLWVNKGGNGPHVNGVTVPLKNWLIDSTTRETGDVIDIFCPITLECACVIWVRLEMACSMSDKNNWISIWFDMKSVSLHSVPEGREPLVSQSLIFSRVQRRTVRGFSCKRQSYIHHRPSESWFSSVFFAQAIRELTMISNSQPCMNTPKIQPAPNHDA